MKRLLCLSGFIAACLCGFSANAQEPDPQVSASLSTIVKYFAHLGQYFGLDLERSPPSVSSEILGLNNLKRMGIFAMQSILQAVPVNTMENGLQNFVPTQLPGASKLNEYANATFKLQTYSSPAANSGTVSVSPLVDQEPPKQDPVSQAVWNILVLGTPNLGTMCDNRGGKTKCQFKNQSTVLSNLLGELPEDLPQGFLSEDYTKKFMSQLNGNSLIAPLMYSNEMATLGTGSPTPQKEDQGLTAQNQAQQVANFVRYVSGAVNPIAIPDSDNFTKLFLILSRKELDPKSKDGIEQQRQKLILARYLTNLRTYAAQSSVGYSNLYFILSKRLPQAADAPSQAKTEFDMATRRLFVPEQDSGPKVKQWIDEINTASSTTLQKEIAMLLAEMNYQLYLNRQIQERILLTNTIALMQNTVSNAPKLDLMNNEEAGVAPP
jgi:intracellular multiplication protein IcmX